MRDQVASRSVIGSARTGWLHKLAAIGISEMEPNIRHGLARRKFTAVFLVQCMEAIGARELRL